MSYIGKVALNSEGNVLLPLLRGHIEWVSEYSEQK